MEVEKYEVLEKIGHGSFGVIRKVRRKSDGYVLCRKEISYLQMSAKEREQLQAELSILKNLRHPNIVAYYEREHLKASSDLHIYMEYCEQGDLGRHIKELKRTNQSADEDFVWSVFTQTVTALYRCHYGEDPPEVGKNVLRLSDDARPLRSKQSHAMILHRDLKPENIFLSADTSVKLGDFGLSKIMQSHDFASTYVGTPFYMSPEICAAENYSLHSDIWAFGCIMYELCAKEPPFNAKTHLELIQKIRLGKVKPLSPVYSTELQQWIGNCLRVNPQSRPDTVQLLNIPMVKLKRKELEIVRVGRHLKAKEETLARKLLEAEDKLAQAASSKESMRLALDGSLRREWEVRARLEIDRQVQITVDKLNHDFEAEVQRRVSEEVEKHKKSSHGPVRSLTPSPEDLPKGTAAPVAQSFQNSGFSIDSPSMTDFSELSLESPTLNRSKPLKRNGRTPFSRAQTMFEGSPADISMADASPAPIASLGLSPRRNAHKPSRLGRNIFSAASDAASWSSNASGSSPLDSEDEIPDDEGNEFAAILPSPTDLKSTINDPFKALGARRPAMLRQKTAPPQKLGSQSQPDLFGGLKAMPSKEHRLPTPGFAKQITKALSPTRRIPKPPSSNSLIADAGSPLRKAPAPPASPSRSQTVSGLRAPSRNKLDDMRQAAMLNNHVQGRTLVELSQARTANAVLDEGDVFNMKSKRSDGIATRDFAAAGKLTSNKDSMPPTVWDPERDEMPSPFLARGGRGLLPGAMGGPGLRHLR